MTLLIKLMYEFIEYDIIDKVDELVNLPKFSFDGKIYEFDIDIFKYVYNISKRDFLVMPSNIPLMTINGIINTMRRID